MVSRFAVLIGVTAIGGQFITLRKSRLDSRLGAECMNCCALLQTGVSLMDTTVIPFKTIVTIALTSAAVGAQAPMPASAARADQLCSPKMHPTLSRPPFNVEGGVSHTFWLVASSQLDATTSAHHQ